MKIRTIVRYHQSDECPDVYDDEFDGTLIEYIADWFECDVDEVEEMDGYISDTRAHIESDDDYWFRVS